MNDAKKTPEQEAEIQAAKDAIKDGLALLDLGLARCPHCEKLLSNAMHECEAQP